MFDVKTNCLSSSQKLELVPNNGLWRQTWPLFIATPLDKRLSNIPIGCLGYVFKQSWSLGLKFHWLQEKITDLTGETPVAVNPALVGHHLFLFWSFRHSGSTGNQLGRG